jgi:hypothetical protein
MPPKHDSWRVILKLVSRLRFLAIGLLAALTFAAAASAAQWGNLYLSYSSGGSTLDGTRADITVSSASPDTSDCLIHASVVNEQNASKQLESGLVICGSGTSIDGTCSLSNNFVKYVERYNGSSYTCYPHGSASFNTSYLATVDNSSGNGTWSAYISGTLYEAQSGYDNNVNVDEWGEYTDTSCSGWSDSTGFSSWQSYNYSANTWSTVGSANNGTTGCWTTSGLSSGSFSVSN